MVVELLEKYFKDKGFEKREHKERFYPTQSSVEVASQKYKRIQGRCLRSAYYACLGIQEEKEPSTSQSLIMEIGEYTEMMLLDIFKRNGILVDSGVKFEDPKYNISGKLDAIIDYNGIEFGVEIKSIGGNNKWTNNAIFGSNWNQPFPKWQNLLQTLVYCYCFRERLSDFVLLYIRRDTCEIKEFVISIVPDGDKIYPAINGEVIRTFSVTDILERYTLLNNYILAEKTPPRDFTLIYDPKYISLYLQLGLITKRQAESYAINPFGDMECKWCGYRNRCTLE